MTKTIEKKNQTKNREKVTGEKVKIKKETQNQ